MELADLMIGDWVFYNSNVFIEDEYEPTKEWRITQISNGEDINLAVEECYKPIPLTPEILEKNGFSLDDSYKPHLKWISADNRIILHNEDEYLNTFNKWHVHVDTEDMRTIGSIELTYVHQFQQFLRLCEMHDLADNFKI